MTTRFINHLLTGDHASRPAASAVPEGTLYSCTDHTLIYQSDTSSWSTWIDPSGSIPSLTLPSFVAAGTSATGTGNITPGLPSGHTTNDINILFVQSSNQTVAAPAGWAQLGPAVGFGTAAAAGSVRLTIFWKRDSGADSDPTVTDPGDHAIGQIIGIRGCVTTGDPFIILGQTRKTTASTTGTAFGGATRINSCLIVNAFAHALDSASAVFSSWTNASLSSVTERIDVATTDGTGGGIGVATGELSTAGTVAATTVTETSTTDVSSTFAMLPADCVRSGVDVQIFTTPEYTDTWTKPTGAKSVRIVSISGGASGSAGRNAATAAGGGGGGGGMYSLDEFTAGELPSALHVKCGGGGAATAHTDGAASNAGGNTNITNVADTLGFVGRGGGQAATASATGSGGAGGAGGGYEILGSPAAGAITSAYGSASARGGTGGTTAAAGSANNDYGGGGGAGGGTSQAGSAGGSTRRGGGGGGGGRSNTNFGTGGGSPNAGGGQTVGAAGDASTNLSMGGGGGAGGNSASGTGGTGGWPGGGGGGGGSQSGAQGGGAGADGVIVITTII